MDNNEQTLYGIPVSNLKGTEYEGGTYYKANGYSFYVPNDVDDSTPAFIYYPGSGGANPDANKILSFIEANAPQQIIVIPAVSNQSGSAQNYYSLINNIGESNNSNITNISTMGFSAGGPSTYNQLVYNSKNNPDGGPYNTVFCDVVGFNVKDEDLQAIAETGSTVLFLEPKGGTMSQANKMGAAGINVVVATTTGSHAGHVPLNSEALQNGIIDYVTGVSNELANSDIYTFNKYNTETGKWEVITLEQFAELYEFGMFDNGDPFRYYEKLSTIDTLESSNSFLGEKINNLRVAIRDTNFLSSTTGMTFDSTTNIPNVEGDIVQSFFTTCSKLLTILEKDTAKIIDIGNSIEDLNKKLTDDADGLNDSQVTVTPNENKTEQVYTEQNKNDTQDTDKSWTTSTTTTTTNTSSNTSSNTTSSSSNNSSVVVPSNPGSTSSSSTTIENTTSATIAALVTSISKTMVDLEDKIEDKYDTEIKYDAEDPIADDIVDKFWKYDELYSGDNMTVYDGEDGKYKVVIHHENGEIKGVEYYYDLGDKDTATSALKLMQEDFKDLEKIQQEDQYVKLTFKDDLYEGLSLEQLKQVYSEFKELKKPEV